MGTVKALAWSALVVCVSLGTALSAAAQTPVGALAVDERQGDQYGWVVDYETSAAAQGRALQECGPGCSVVLTFGRCAAYAADQDADSTAVGWAESFDSAAGARQAALSECGSRGGARCTVRVWGCNGPVVEDGLGLNQTARQQVQQGLQAEGFAPGGVDGLFGPRTRAAIRNWQFARGVRSTGYLDGLQVEALRSRGGSAPQASVGAAAADSGALELAFWQSIVNSTNPADFEAYLEQFPNGVFRALAQNRLVALRSSAGGTSAAAGSRVGGVGSPASGARVSGAPASLSGTAATSDVRSSPVRFRPDQTCAGQPAGVSCWMEISRQPGCYVWNPNPQPDETVTWTGNCDGGLAQGAGTLTWVSDGNRQANTGRLHDGRFDGHVVVRSANGNVGEGAVVAGQQTGHWVWRYPDGEVHEGPLVAGQRNGHWVIRRADGQVEEGPYVDGDKIGHWVVRGPDGNEAEGPLVGGKRHGNWIFRSRSGRVTEQTYVDGEYVR